MDFFQAQDTARRRSHFLLIYFVAAIVGIVAVVYVIAVVAIHTANQSGIEATPRTWWQPEILAVVSVGVLGLIGLGTAFKLLALRAGGGAVARSVGGRRVEADTTDPAERRLLNVVEEMAIASGVRVPDVYVLPEEGINAFAAGYSSDDAAVAVTQGALATLNRDELQGVIAHEFSHILNGDMRLNVRLIGLLFGILLLAIIGRGVLHSLRFTRTRGKGSGGVIAAILVLSFTLLTIGYVGVLFGRLIQAAISRQREFLADAAAVQFTRNPSGIAGALKKIGGLAAGARVRNTHAAETGHMFFANALQGSAFNLFATHPPLPQRIRAIEPAFDGRFPSVIATPLDTAPEPSRARRAAPPPLSPAQFITAIAAGAEAAEPGRGAAVIQSIPELLREFVHEPARVRAVVLALLAAPEDAGAEQRQAAALASTLTPVEIDTGARAVPLLKNLSIAARFALLDLALPTLRRLPAETLVKFQQAADALVAADFKVTPFEFAIQHVIRRHLRAPGRAPASPGVAPTLRPLPADVAGVLANIARAGSDDLVATQQAYAAGARHFGLSDDRLAPAAPGLGQLATALERLDRASLTDKRRLLESLAQAASADHEIKPDEVALLRAFAAALDCPAPMMQTA